MVEQSKFDLEIISEIEEARREGFIVGFAKGVSITIRKQIFNMANNRYNYNKMLETLCLLNSYTKEEATNILDEALKELKSNNGYNASIYATIQQLDVADQIYNKLLSQVNRELKISKTERMDFFEN